MTLPELLTQLRHLDVRLRLHGSDLRFDAPPGVMTESLRQTLKQWKSELVTSLRAEAADDAAPIPRRPRIGPLPVSFAQRRMWFGHELTPDSPVYTLVGAIRLEGTLDIEALGRSLGEIQQRHETLRTTFAVQDDEPVQRIHEAAGSVLSLIDLSGAAEADRQQQLAGCTTAWSREPFDLVAGPLFRARLVKESEQSHVLFLAFHHLVCDGWSIGVFVRELMGLYDAFSRHAASPLPELTIQYADYAIWQRERLTGVVLEEQLAYWRRQLATLPILELPTDRPRPDVQSFNGALHWLTVTPDVAAGVTALARAQRATPFMTLLTAFTIVLMRWSGQDDVVVGSPIANRERPELEPLLGLFVNTLPLRARLERGRSFRSALDHVREVCLGAFEHQDVPLDLIVEDLKPGRDPRYSPVYQAMFALQTAAVGTLDLRGLRVTPLETENVTAKFDLTLSLSERNGGYSGVLEFNTDLFDRGTASRLGESFKALLEDAVAHPDRRIDELNVFAAPALRLLLAHGEGVHEPYPDRATLSGLFAAQVAARPDAMAIEDEQTRWSYREVAARATRLAGVLQALGVGRDVRVGVWLERGAALVTTLVGIVQSGGAYVPLEPGQPAARAAAVLADTGATVVVTTAALAAAVPAGPWQVVTLEAVEATTARPVIARASADDLAYVLYTSGSTGRPKGVAVTQRAIVHLVCGTDYVALGPDRVVAQVATPAFDAATFEIWGALLHGGRLVVVPTAVAIAPTALGAYLQRTGVTTLFLTTALVHQIGREAPGALAGLDTLLFGGEAVEPRWVAALQAAGGPRRLVHVYGPTETTTFATWQVVAAVAADAATIPIGGPIAHTQVSVLDRAGALAPVGVIGELCIGGAGVAQGYLGAARLTAAAFVPDGVSGAAGRRLYRTGDLVRWRADHTLEFVGRRDGQVKLRGYRIELGEVEAALRAVPAVGAAVALVRGTGLERHLVAYVTAAGGAVEAGAVREALKRRLPGYMVPAAVVVLPALPLTSHGKLDRGALPAPETSGTDRAGGPEPAGPHGSMEAAIAGVWRQVLGVSGVGRQDNFFDLGGHSLLLVRVQAELESALGRRVPLIQLFQYPTVEALASQLKGVEPAARPEARPRPTADDRAIAIVGMAGRFPGAPDVVTFWQQLREGRESIRRFTDEELEAAGVSTALRNDPRYVPARATIDRVDEFDAELFGFTPREATLLDPQQRVLLECAWTALEHAGYAPGTRPVRRVGVYAGTSTNTYLASAGRATLAAAGPMQLMLASDKDFLATRISYKLQLTGPSVTVQTACSTSLVAVHTACQAVLAGECDLALAGGVSISVPDAGYVYQPEGIASPDGHCRPFDAHAAGTVAGNGAGVVVLKRLTEAVADGDTIHAVILGTAVNNDGADKVGFTAPSVSGQAAVIAAALAAAGVPAASIGYVEAHGTATSLGDPIEVAALRQVFGDAAGPATCGLGSVKGNIGHLDAAAGVTGLIKTVLALSHRELPPSLHFQAPNPQIDLGPFFVPTQVMAWPERELTPRRAGVSSFGIGGTNAHVVLEEAPHPQSSAVSRPWQILPIAGQTAAAATAAAAAMAAMLRTTSEAFADVTYTAQVGRAPLRVRRAVVGRTAAEMVDALAQAPTVATSSTPSLVWLFPGQGAQVVGMGRELFESEPVFRQAIDSCAEALHGHLDGDLRTVLYPSTAEGPLAVERLSDTRWAQAGLVAVEIASAALWRSWGIVPDAVMGHSVGEIAAACVAGVITLADAMRLTAVRGIHMALAPPGAMVAVGADSVRIAGLLGPDLWMAAINSPAQCVVAGTTSALADLEARLEGEELLTQRLAAAGAFHSELMADVAAPLTAAAATLARALPTVPWISTVTGRMLDGAEAIDAGYWGRQVVAPVQWAAAVASARQTFPGAVWLEVGPGRTLTNLLRVSADEAVVRTLDGGDAAESIARALAGLWTLGITPDWHAYHAGSRRRRVPLPSYPFQRQRYWLTPAKESAADPAAALFSRNPDVGAWFYRPFWKQAAPAPEVSPESTLSKGTRRWLLLGDETHVVGRLQARLAAAGHDAIVAAAGDRFAARPGQRYDLRWGVAGDYEALFHTLDTRGVLPTDIVHVLGVTASADCELADIQERCFDSLMWIAAALSRFPSQPVRLTVVTNHVHAVTGTEELSPAKAMVLGPCRTISAELSHVVCRHADVLWTPHDSHGASQEADLVDALWSEIFLEETANSVASRGRHRWVQEFEPWQAPASSEGLARLRPQGVYLITGGFGAIGMSIAESLARLVGAQLVLVGRTELPDPERWDREVAERPDHEVARRIRMVRALESRGSAVLVASGDVASVRDMRAVFERARSRFGSIHGVIHAAGVPGGGLIVRKQLEVAAAVLSPKVAGTLVLAQLLEETPVDFLALCSSLTAFLGGAGQVDYCAANSFLDAFAHARSGVGGTRVLSINWDTWRDHGMAAEADVPRELWLHKERALASGMSTSEGQEVFLRALALRLPQIAVCTKDLLPLMAAMRPARPRVVAGPVTATAAEAGQKHGRPALTTPYAPPTREAEQRVCAAFEQALGIEGIGVHDNFFELGGHSLSAVEVMALLNRQFGSGVPVAALYEGLTAGVVALRFEDHGNGRWPPMTAGSRRHNDQRPTGASRRRDSRVERRQRP